MEERNLDKIRYMGVPILEMSKEELAQALVYINEINVEQSKEIKNFKIANISKFKNYNKTNLSFVGLSNLLMANFCLLAVPESHINFHGIDWVLLIVGIINAIIFAIAGFKLLKD